MKHRVRSDVSAERRLAITPEVAGWPHLTFRTYGFPADRPVDGESVDDEVCMLFLAGLATVTVGDETWSIDRGAGVFSGPPQCLYLPPQHRYLLTPRTDCEVAYARWPAHGAFAPRFIAPETVVTEERGSGVTAHRVTHLLRGGEAEHLICAEVLVPPGHWCLDSPLTQQGERVLAAGHICYYRLASESGWALQRLYANDGTLDEVGTLAHGDAVMVGGYRQAVVAAPDYQLYSLHVGALLGRF